MPKKLKDYYGVECAELLAGKLAKVRPAFPRKKFIQYIDERVDDKEFLARQDVFVEALACFLGEDYTANLNIISQILGEELSESEGMFKLGWWLWPIGRYVEKHGTQNVPQSLNFIYELTKRFTGEFAIRPLLEADAKRVLKTMERWSRDKNVHVRRLASEGLRLRLPWAKKNNIALEYFEEVFAILNNLKHDAEKFVQKSVGNNLNDMMKDCPEKAWQIIHIWEKDKPTKATLWIIKHGTRSLRKSGAP